MNKAAVAASALVMAQVAGVGVYLWAQENVGHLLLLPESCTPSAQAGAVYCVGTPAWEVYAVGIWLITMVLGLAKFVRWYQALPASQS